MLGREDDNDRYQVEVRSRSPTDINQLATTMTNYDWSLGKNDTKIKTSQETSCRENLGMIGGQKKEDEGSDG